MKYISLLMVLVALSLIGCSGETLPGVPGSAGAQGEKGDMGDAGTKGAQGNDGDQGIPGARGLKGDPGTVNGVPVDGSKITHSMFCQGTLQSTSLSFTYNAVVFQNNNVLAMGSIIDGVDETQSTRMYAPTQNGWVNAAVSLQYDAAVPMNGGWWSLTLDRNTLITTITYHDIDVVGGVQSWTMTPDKCVVNNYQ